jgi:predicted O-linked N-acetylglucosamine transferase (SPINDLY family)
VNLAQINAALLESEGLFLQGNLGAAREKLLTIIEVNADHPKVNELLGYIAANQGSIDQAINHLRVATKSTNTSASAIYELGSLLLSIGQSSEASGFFEKALSIEPNFYEARYELGLAFAQQQKLDQALLCFQLALETNPNAPDIFYNIARIYDEKKSFNLSVAYYEKAIEQDIHFIDAWVNRGLALKELKRFQEAVICYDHAIGIQENNPQAWLNKGNVLKELVLYQEALQCYNRALELSPGYAEVLSNISNLLIASRQFQEAIEFADRAIAANSGLADSWLNKSIALKKLRCREEAIQCIHKAIAIKPASSEYQVSLGDILTELKRYEEALEAYQQALTFDPKKDYLYGLTVYLKTLICDWSHYDQQLANIRAKLAQGQKVVLPFSLLALLDDEAAHFKAAQLFAEDKFPENAYLGPIPKRVKDQKIRLGYFSADFRSHPVASLIAELFELHDRNQFEIIGFSIGSDDADEMRLRLKGSFDQFIDVNELSDQEVAHLARDLKIDIAIDLGGYTQDCRTSIFSYRAAPIQVNYLGYPGTMGSRYMDYIIADPILIPPENQNYYSEKIIYLPHTYQANDRKRKISTVPLKRAAFDLPENGFVFCCFNNNFKLTPYTLDSWCRILKAVEGSILWLYEGHEKTKLNLINEFMKRGLAYERLIFAKRVPSDEHLARYRLADLFLDTLPYNAHTTTSDALWAGTPVLTLIGRSFAGRVAASLLNAIGMHELITKSAAEYEAKAIELGNHPEKLKEIRRQLQANRDTTALFNAPLFTQDLELAYAQIYQRYQDDVAPEHLWVD